MRAAYQLDSEVDVRQRALKAAERVGTNGRLQETFDAPEYQPTLLERLLPSPEELVVNGRHVTGFVVPHWAAAVLLAAVLGAVGFMYSQLSNQRDMLIRLDTQLQERAQHESEYRHTFENKLELQQVYINDLNKQMVSIRTILTPQQLRTISKQNTTN